MTELTIQGLKIERLIAKGGMAEVYLAEQTSLGRKVAVKVLDSGSKDPEFIERFLHEAKLVAALHHNNIITIYDFGRLDNNRLFLSMEYLPGGDMETRLKKGISEKETLHILKELARGLNFIHQKHIIHRDIKPANILFRQDDSLVLTDFGIAKAGDDKVTVTQTGMTVGSPAYSSPEQAQGKVLDHRTDIYSVGVVMYEMLTGVNPFRANTNIDTAIKHIQMPVPALPGKFSRYQAVLNKMLAKEPKDRFASMLEVLDALDALGTKKEKTALTATKAEPVGNIANNSGLVTRCADESKVFAAMLMKNFHETITKRFEELQENSRSNAQVQLLLEVARNTRKKKDEVNRDFQKYLEAGFNDFARGEYKSDATFQIDQPIPDKLSLLANDDLERNIAASTLIKNIQGRYSEELALLHERLCEVIKKNLPLEACPVGPYQLANHFKQAVQPLGLEKQITALFFKTLEKNLQAQLGDLYKQLNQQLVDAGVLPKLTSAEVHRRHQPQAAANNNSFSASGLNQLLDEEIRQFDRVNHGSVASLQHTQMQQAITPNAELPSSDYQQQLFGAIRQMQQTGFMVPPTTGQMAALNDAPANWVPAGYASPDRMMRGPVYARNDIVTALSGLQGTALEGAVTLTGNTASIAATTTAQFQALRPGHLQPYPVQALDAVMDAIAEISPDGDGEPKQLNQNDSGMIDLVAMIFEYMLKDEHLPDSVKALLSYLQVPYIKVALLDPDLFAKPEHPARVLLDRLSEAGTLWLNKDGYGQFRVFDEIKRVVNRVLNEFSDRVELFDQFLQEFNDYVATVKRRTEQLEKLAVQREEAEQHLQNVRAYVHKRIKTRVADEHIPAAIVAFLLYPWFDYLTSLMLRHGEKSEQWQQGLQVIDSLLWSIKPKTTPHEITRLNNLRDLLNSQIQKGFDTIGYNQAKADELLLKLAELQQLAAKSNEPIKVSAADRTEITRMVKEVTVRESIVLPPDTSTMTADEKDLVEKLRMIEFGTWFEFKEGEKGEAQKLKVAWFNSENLSYLMVNSAGKQVSMITALELARQLIAKTARIIAGSAKPFFERALEAIYKKMADAMTQQKIASPNAAITKDRPAGGNAYALPA
jgi:serine/threonine protein kinase